MGGIPGKPGISGISGIGSSSAEHTATIHSRKQATKAHCMLFSDRWKKTKQHVDLKLNYLEKKRQPRGVIVFLNVCKILVSASRFCGGCAW